MKIAHVLASDVFRLRFKGVALRLGSVLLFCAGICAQGGWAWFEDEKLHASDGGYDGRFGGFLSLHDDTALIGRPVDDVAGQDSGSAYIFTRSGTAWSQQAKLLAAGGQPDDRFGNGTSIDGDTALIGAQLEDSGGSNAGAAYVFVGSGSSWNQQAKLTATDATSGDEFGYMVSLDGDTALVGACKKDDLGADSGAAYVFTRTGSTWTQQAKLLAADGAANDWFGFAVAVSGDTALIGARGDDGQGSAYVFTRTGTIWTQQAKLTAADGQQGDEFGEFVAVDGDTGLIGALNGDGLVADCGAAYVFTRTGSTWTQQDKLTADDGAENDAFGRVSIDGDTALIGALLGDGRAPDSGAAYVYFRAGSTWEQEDKLIAADGAAGDRFGDAASIHGSTILIGATLDDDQWYNSGSAYVFEYKVLASATFRNRGANPSSHDAVTLPIIGQTYQCTIDVAGTTGHNLAWLVGYSTPTTLITINGLYVLVNPFDPNGELLQLPILAGPVATYSLPIPNDIAYAGLGLATQAIHLGGVHPFSLSNAQDLVLGY